MHFRSYLSSRLNKHVGSAALKTSIVLGTALCVIGSFAMPAQAGPGPVVATTQGKVQGFVVNGVSEFLGIPYAAPPVGNLRWRPPIAHAPWGGVKKATAFGPTCAQITTLGVFAGPANNNEDCLYLNVFTPNPSATAKRPVLVWIHGGGNYDGESNDYDGSKLASQGNTVVVTLNYRLNLMGFMALPDIDNHEGHPFGNYGIMDQQFVLKWVQTNIANFGGDPTNVTVGGQSAGASDTGINMVSPLSAGLLEHGICESSCPINEALLSVAENKGAAFEAAAGCGSQSTPAARVACLRALPAATIESLAGTASATSPYIQGPMVDGTVLPVLPIQAWHTGAFNKPMTIMNGRVEDEENFFTAIIEYFESPQAPLTAAQYEAFVNTTYTAPNALPPGLPYPAGTAAAVLAHYPLSAYPSAQLTWDAVGTDPASCAETHVNDLLGTKVPLYAYEFDDRTAPFYFPKLPGFVSWAYHTADIQYLFPFYHGGNAGIPHPLNAKQTILSNELVAAWTNFANTGNANGTGTVPWHRWTGSTRQYLSENISALSTLTAAQYAQRHMCAFWAGILPYTYGAAY